MSSSSRTTHSPAYGNRDQCRYANKEIKAILDFAEGRWRARNKTNSQWPHFEAYDNRHGGRNILATVQSGETIKAYTVYSYSPPSTKYNNRGSEDHLTEEMPSGTAGVIERFGETYAKARNFWNTRQFWLHRCFDGTVKTLHFEDEGKKEVMSIWLSKESTFYSKESARATPELSLRKEGIYGIDQWNDMRRDRF